MCWRDDVPQVRYCIFCKEEYYGDLGHRGCPAFKEIVEEEGPPAPSPRPLDEETESDPF